MASPAQKETLSKRRRRRLRAKERREHFDDVYRYFWGGALRGAYHNAETPTGRTVKGSVAGYTEYAELRDYHASEFFGGRARPFPFEKLFVIQNPYPGEVVLGGDLMHHIDYTPTEQRILTYLNDTAQRSPGTTDKCLRHDRMYASSANATEETDK